MVPYEAVIPGTDVKYKMIPVPGGIATIGSPKSEADRRENEGMVTFETISLQLALLVQDAEDLGGVELEKHCEACEQR